MRNFFHYFFKILLFSLLLFFMVGTVFLGKEFYLDQRNTEIKFFVEGKNIDDLAVSKNDAVVIQFSNSVLQESVESHFNFEGDLSLSKEWRGKRYFRIEIEEYPDPEKKYKIFIDNIRTKWYIPIKKNVELEFSGIPSLKIEQIEPPNEQVDVEYNSTIKLDLNKKMGEEYFLEFKSKPKINFDYTIAEDRSYLEIIPLEELQKNTRYDIEINVRHRAFENFKENIYKGYFITKTPPEIVYSFDKNGDPLKTQEREEEIVAQIKEGRYIDIDLSSQSLFIFENGLEKGAFKVSTGKQGMDTPVGTFSVLAKAQRPWSQKYALYMPWFIQFTNHGHGIHELPEWPGGVKEGVYHLGIPVSHGCVRLGVGPAKIVYDFAEVGTPIVIHQ